LFWPFSSVEDPDPGSDAFLTPGSGIGFFRISDPGSQTHIFESFVTIFLCKKFYNSLKIGPTFFLQLFKNKIIYNFMKFVATKEGMTSIFFSSLSFVLVFGSGMGKNQDPG
jgi:hypothetical protein